MRAWTADRRAQKGAKKYFEMYMKDAVVRSLKVSLATVAYLMHKKWGCSPETCRRRINDVIDMLKLSDVGGRQLDDTHILTWCEDHLGIDFSAVDTKIVIEYDDRKE